MDPTESEPPTTTTRRRHEPRTCRDCQAPPAGQTERCNRLPVTAAKEA